MPKSHALKPSFRIGSVAGHGSAVARLLGLANVKTCQDLLDLDIARLEKLPQSTSHLIAKARYLQEVVRGRLATSSPEPIRSEAPTKRVKRKAEPKAKARAKATPKPKQTLKPKQTPKPRRIRGPLAGLPLVGRLLDGLGVSSLEALSEMDLYELSKHPGVGKLKLRELERLLSEGGFPTRVGGIRNSGAGDLRSPFSHPTSELHALPIVGQLLRRLDIGSLEALSSVDLDELSQRPGVAKVKLRELERLLHDAGLSTLRGGIRHDANGTPLEFPNLPAELTPYLKQDPLVVLGRVPGGVGSFLANRRLSTVGALWVWLVRHAHPTPLATGSVTAAQLRELIDDLVRYGPERMMYGGPRPTSLPELVERYLSHRTDELTRWVLDGRYRRGLTFQSLALEGGRSVQAVSQLLKNVFEKDTPGWQDVMVELMGPILEVLTRRGVVVPLSDVEPLLGGLSTDGLRLVLDFWRVIAASRPGVASWSLVQTRFPALTTQGSTEAKTLLKEVASSISDYTRRSSDAHGVYAIMRERRLLGTDEELRAFAERAFPVSFVDDHVFSTRVDSRSEYETALFEIGRPATIAQVLEHLEARGHRDDHAEPATRAASLALKASAHVVRTYSGVYVHLAHLDVPTDQLEQAVSDSLDLLRLERGKALSCAALLERVAPQRPPSFTRYVLRDALLASGEVRAWPGGDDLAWNGAGVAYRRGIEWWIEKLARASQTQPVALDRLVEDVARATGFGAGSIRSSLSRHPGLLSNGRGYAYSRAVVLSPIPGEVEKLTAWLVSRFPPDGVTSALMLAAEAPPCGIRVPWAPDLAFAILRTLPGVATRLTGQLAWHATLGTELWHVWKPFGNELPHVFRARDAHRRLTTFSNLSYVAVLRLLQEGVAHGRLAKLEDYLYLDLQSSDDDLREYFRGNPSLIKYVPMLIADDAHPRVRSLCAMLR